MIVADARGGIHLAWKDRRAGPHAIYYRGWRGGVWEAEQLIASAGSWLVEQDIAVDAEGRVHAAWVALPLFYRELHYRSRTETGWTADTLLAASRNQVWDPAVGCDNEGRVHVVWEDARQGNRDLWAVHRLDGRWGSEEQLTSLPTASILPDATVDARGTLHLAWSDNRNDFHNLFYLRWTAPDGWSPHERVTIDSSDAYRACLTTDDEGNLHMVWSDNRDDNKEIYYAVRPPDEPWEPIDPGGGDLVVRCLPNPCRAATTIRARLPSAGDWTLRVFDGQGRLIDATRETITRSGDHDFAWSARSAAGRPPTLGVYFVRVSGPGHAATTRLVFARP